MKRGRQTHVKRRKSVCAEGQRAENRDNPVTSQYTSKRTWRAMKDGGAGHKKLLVARSDEGSKEIHREM